MEKSLVQEILEHLIICGSRLMLDSFFTPYGQSLGQALREAERSASLCPHDFSGHSRGTVSVTLHRMKKKNLVLLSGSKKKAMWHITRKGRDHFKSTSGGIVLPPEDGKTRVVMFDVPEDRRGERNWLRKELLACDYAPLQKSVFMGTRPFPVKLLKEFKSRGLLSYVHVVGIEV